jgi:hypothetical protein
MSERVKSRKVTIYDYDDEGHERDTETSFEPIVQEAAPEFVGVVATVSLPHGQVPVEVGEWSVYKVYEKVVIWLRRAPSTPVPVEASP